MSCRIVDAGADGEGDAATRVTVKQSKEQTDKIRSRFKSTVHMAAFFLADRHCRALAVMMGELEQPVLQASKRHALACQTPWGSREWYIKQCYGDTQHVREMVQLLCNRLVLPSWGFQLGWGALNLPEDVRKENDSKSAAALLIMRKVSALELVTCSMLMWRPPYCFAGLLSSDPHVQEVCTQRLKEIYKALEMLETTSRAGEWTRRFLQDLHWPRSTIIRELFIAMSESQWIMPADAKHMIMSIFSGHGCSKQVEEAFKVVVQHTPASGKMNRMTRLATVMNSSLLSEYGQRELEPLPSQPKPTPLSEDSMKVTIEDFSLGMDVAAALREDFHCVNPPTQY
eukprot:1058577-Amphidinium_carterae.1